nr:sn1-specific diacylglycerol lipase beta isoform X2 [Ipomoea trifida]
MGISVVMAAEASLSSCGRADIAAISAIGLALLHRYSLSSKLCEEPLPVPEEMIHEAALFHPFAEAAYTGLLLDVGRNPILFPLSWLCRQGVFSPWARKRTFMCTVDLYLKVIIGGEVIQQLLKYVKLTDDVLRKGCANQHFQLQFGDHNLGWVSTLTVLTHFVRSIHLDDLPIVALRSEKRGVHARWYSKVCLLALPVRARNKGHNVVFGKVPEAIAQLQKVNLSHNRLCGQLPPTNFSASAFAGNACLCGAPLPPCKAA